MHCTGSALGIGTDRTGNWKKWSCRDGGEHFLIKYCCCGAVIIIWFPDVDLFLYFLQPATCYINLCVASSNRGGSLGWHKTSSGCLLQCFSSHVVRALEHCGSDQNYFRLSGKYFLIVNQNDVSWNTNRCCQAQVLRSMVFVHLPSKECSKVGIELSNTVRRFYFATAVFALFLCEILIKFYTQWQF